MRELGLRALLIHKGVKLTIIALVIQSRLRALLIHKGVKRHTASNITFLV